MLRTLSSRCFLVLLALVICTGNIYAAADALAGASVSVVYVNPGPTVQSWGSKAPLLTNNDVSARYYRITTINQNWLTASVPATVVAAGATTPVTVTVAPGANAGNLFGLTYGAGGNTGTFVIEWSANGTNGWVTDLTITTTLKLYASPFASALPVAPLADTTAKTSSVSYADAAITVAAPVFAVDNLTEPAWLIPVTCNTTCTAGNLLNFQVVANIATILKAGSYPANIGLVISGYTEFYIPIEAVVTGSGGPGSYYVQDGNGNKLSATPVTTNVPANAVPPITVTLFGNPDPVNMTAMSCSVALKVGGDTDPGGACAVTDGNGNIVTKGVAYSMGLQTVLQVSPIEFSQRVGNTVEISFLFTDGAGAAQTYKMDYLLLGGQVSLTSVFPTSVQKFTAGSQVVVLTGKNFVGAQNSTGGAIKPTQVWWGDSLAHLSNPPTGANGGQIAVGNITVSGDGTTMFINFTGNTFTGKAGNVVYLGTANQVITPLTSFPSAANGGVSASFKITAGPVVTSITNAASYQVVAPTTANVAPYELISIFGSLIPATDFTDPTHAVTPAIPDPVFGQYPTTIPIGTKGNKVSVSFYTDQLHTQGAIAAPLLFAAPGQINAIVPSTLVVGTPYYVSVDYLTVSSTGVKTSSYSDSYMITAVAADPGIFTMDGSGTGQGAVIVNHTNGTFVLNGTTVSTEATDTDVLSIYMTGLGAPDSTDVDSGAALLAGDNGCLAVTTGDSQNPGYLEYVNGLSTPPTLPWATIDGAILKSAWVLSPHYAPCLGSTTYPVTVTFYALTDLTKSATGTVQYAGFVADSVAGLYQVNVAMPAGLKATLSNASTAWIQVSISSSSASSVLGTTALVSTIGIK